MEDQQPAAGYLTVEDSVDADAAESEAGQPESEPSEAESAVDSAAGDEIDDGTIEAETRQRHRRPAGKWSIVAAAVAAVFFVGSAAFAGATVQPYLKDRATVETKLRIARTAANAITTLWTYNPQDMDKLADRAAQYLSGDFEAAYRKYIDQIAPVAKQTQITNTTKVTGAAVESLNGPDAIAVVYTNTSSRTPATKDFPSLKYYSYRLTLKRDHAQWLVTKMTTLTSFDLTPKF